MFTGTLAQTVTNSYIVELEDKPILHHVTPTDNDFSLATSNLHQEIKDSHIEVLNHMKKKGIQFTKKREFLFGFNGFTIELDESKVKDISQIPGVKGVYDDKEFSVELANSVPLTGAPEVWKEVDQANNQVTGKGVNVAVIDTGIDYTHPDLGGGFGSGNKVISGYNYVDNNDDPYDTHGHGTHVAGIVAANGKMKGVAPEASLLAYKVVNDAGKAKTSDIMAAIEDAIDPQNPHRSDVINISLGINDDVGQFITGMAEYAVKSGIVVATSSGNTGPSYGTITHPGGAEGVLTVGASTSGVKVPNMKLVSPTEVKLDTYRFGFSANTPEEPFRADLVDVGQGDIKDYEDIDVKDKIVLIQSSSTGSYINKAQIAEEMGARGAILFLSYNIGWPNRYEQFMKDENIDGRFEHELHHEFSVLNNDSGRFQNLIAVEISEQTALELREYLTEQNVTIEVSSNDLTDEIPSFSSRGEAENFRLGLNLVAPGVELASTFPLKLSESGTHRASGTSGASPHVAGAAALLKQLHPNWLPEDISSALIGTSKNLDSYDPLTQGGGRLDVLAATRTNITTSKNDISFGLANFAGDQFSESQTFTVKNHGEETAELSLKIDQFDRYSTVEVNPSHLAIEPGQTTEVEITLTGEHPDHYEDIMGWVHIEDQAANSVFQLPYYLAARPLLLYVSPDPAYGSTDVFIYSPVEEISAPNITVQAPNGKRETLQAKHDHGSWWRATKKIEQTGIYTINAVADLKSERGVVLKGTTKFEGEVYSETISPSETATWEAIGPNAAGARLNIDPRIDNKMYATAGDGFFVTENGGETWKEIRNLPVAGGSIKQHIIDPDNQDIWYVAINGGSNDVTYNGRLLRSDDGGKNWSIISFPDKEIKEFTLSDSGNFISVLNDNTILYSEDKGSTWESIEVDLGTYYDSEVIDSLLLIGTTNGLYKIDLATKNKKPVLIFESPSSLPWVQRVAGDDSIMLATTFSHGLFASLDKGETWEQVNEEIAGLLQYLDVVDGTIYAAKSRYFWSSSDYGKTWEDLVQPVASPPVQVTHAKSGGMKYVTASGGIYATTEGLEYNRIGIPGAQIYDMAFLEDELIVGTNYDTYKKDNPNDDLVIQEWGMSGQEASIGSTVMYIEELDSDPNIVYKIRMGGQVGSFYVHKSEDGGENWEIILSGNAGISTLFIHPANEDYIVIPFSTVTSQGIYVSKDGGQTWNTQLLEHIPLTIVGDPNNPNRYWTGAADGLYVTEDGGENFTKLQDIPINVMDINPNDPDHIVFGGRDFYYTEDGGETIEKGEFENLGIFIMDMIFNPVDHNVIYAATGAYFDNNLRIGGRGVLRSTDGGKTWHSLSEDLDNKNVTSLATSPNASHLFAGTSGGSVYRLKLFDIVEVEPATDQELNAGDEIEVSFKSNYNGGVAQFTVQVPNEDHQVETADLTDLKYEMTEIEPGFYKGTWVAPADMEMNGAVIEVELQDRDGNSVRKEAEGRIFVTLDDEKPEEPEEPGDPEEPEEPEEPGEPGDPEDPKDPEDPEDPENEDPKNPEDPQEPDNPESPEDSSNDDQNGEGDNGDHNSDDNDDKKDGEKDKDDDDKGARENTNNDGTKTPGGQQVPKTATSMFNWILIGALTILAGISIIVVSRVRGARD